MFRPLDFVLRANADYIDEQYSRWQADPASVPPEDGRCSSPESTWAPAARPAKRRSWRAPKPASAASSTPTASSATWSRGSTRSAAGQDRHPFLETAGVRARRRPTSTAPSRVAPFRGEFGGTLRAADRGAARDLLRHARGRVHGHLGPRASATGWPTGSSVALNRPHLSPARARRASCARCSRPTGSSSSCTRATPGRSASRSRAARASIPMFETLTIEAAALGVGVAADRHAAPRAAQRPREHHEEAARDDLQRVRVDLRCPRTSRATAT